MDAESQLFIARLDNLSKDIELLRRDGSDTAKDASTKDEGTKWYAKLVQILAIPAAIIAIFLQVGQFHTNTESDSKIEAETAKLRIDRLSGQVELEKKLDELQKSRVADANSLNLNDTISKLKEAISESEKLREAETKGALVDVFMRFIIVWFLYNAWGVFFGILSLLWNTILTPVMILAQRYGRRYEWVNSLFPIYGLIITIVPSFIDWYVRLLILIAVAEPMAQDAAVVLGREKEFSELITSFNSAHIRVASQQLGQLFTSLPTAK
jgi:hypothetical protein